MDIKERIAIHNRFDVEVIRNGEVIRKAVGYNKIVNQLYTRLIGGTYYGGTYAQCIAYGSGSGTPSVNDTALFHYEGYKQNEIFSSEYDWEHNVASMTKKIQLSEQDAVGVEITEVGLAYDGGDNKITTHAMLEDMNGNPISIEKTDVDVINIYSTIYIHWNGNAKFTPFLLRAWAYGGDQWSLRQWLFGVAGDWNQQNAYVMFEKVASRFQSNWDNTDISVYGGVPSWDANNYKYVGKNTSWAADVANKKTVMTVERLEVDDGNVPGGIGCMIITSGGGAVLFYIPAEDVLGGTDITNEAVGTGDGTETEFALDFDFPTNAKIYINGVQKTSGVTVREIPMGTVPLWHYMRSLSLDSMSPSKVVDSPIGRQSNYIKNGEILYNRAYAIGVSGFSNNNGGKVWGSNDLDTWELLMDTTDTSVTLTGAQQNYRYFKAETNGTNYNISFTTNTYNGKAIVFDTPPANGAVITADYHTPYVAKDSDHVFDFKITWQFGEYTE